MLIINTNHNSIICIKNWISLNAIGDYTFYECFSLEQITIPSSIVKFGFHAFCGCSSAMIEIDDFAFYDCSSLKQIIIPLSVTSIGNSSLNGCSSLTQITFNTPSSLTKIEFHAFFECESLVHIEIPSSVTEIKDNAFLGCSSLIEIAIRSFIRTNDLGIQFKLITSLNKFFFYSFYNNIFYSFFPSPKLIMNK